MRDSLSSLGKSSWAAVMCDIRKKQAHLVCGTSHFEFNYIQSAHRKVPAFNCTENITFFLFWKDPFQKRKKGIIFSAIESWKFLAGVIGQFFGFLSLFLLQLMDVHN